MEKIRELTQKGDPILRIKLPASIVGLLKDLAKQNKRRYQDELIKRLSVSFHNNQRTEALQLRLIPKLKKIYQS